MDNTFTENENVEVREVNLEALKKEILNYEKGLSKKSKYELNNIFNLPLKENKTKRDKFSQRPKKKETKAFGKLPNFLKGGSKTKKLKKRIRRKNG
jgi:hypothetical protein